MNTPLLQPTASRIAGRMQGGWVVGTRLYQPALLVTATVAGSIPGLSFASLDLALIPDGGGIELLLLGTGTTMQAPTDAMLAAAERRGWRLAAMDDAAAARTFNVLVAEDRLVGALLLGDDEGGKGTQAIVPPAIPPVP